MEALAATLDDARAGVAAGDDLDLSGLDARVGGLCAAVASLPREEGRVLAQGLERLLDVLDALSATIGQRRQAALAEQEQTARRRATAAYGRPVPLNAPAPLNAPVPPPDPADGSSSET